MKVLCIKVGQRPQVIELNGLKDMEKFVGGYIEEYPLGFNDFIVCSEEGIVDGLAPNRMVKPGVIIYGDFFICGENKDGTDFGDISEDSIARFSKLYGDPDFALDVEAFERR